MMKKQALEGLLNMSSTFVLFAGGRLYIYA